MMSTLENKITMTPAAKKKILKLMNKKEQKNLAMRIIVAGELPGGGYNSQFMFVPADDMTEEDIVIDMGEFNIYIDKESSVINGVNIDYDEKKYAKGFHAEYVSEPQFETSSPNPDWSPLERQVYEALNEHINPAIRAHGGYVELKEVKNEQAYVEMLGGCQGCSVSAVTLRDGVTRMIMEKIPEIGGVVDITDHDAGINPYYTDQGYSPLG